MSPSTQAWQERYSCQMREEWQPHQSWEKAGTKGWGFCRHFDSSLCLQAPFGALSSCVYDASLLQPWETNSDSWSQTWGRENTLACVLTLPTVLLGPRREFLPWSQQPGDWLCKALGPGRAPSGSSEQMTSSLHDFKTTKDPRLPTVPFCVSSIQQGRWHWW